MCVISTAVLHQDFISVSSYIICYEITCYESLQIGVNTGLVLKDALTSTVVFTETAVLEVKSTRCGA